MVFGTLGYFSKEKVITNDCQPRVDVPIEFRAVRSGPHGRFVVGP